MLVDDVISAVNIERLAGNQLRCIMRKKGCRHANIVDADEALGGGLRLCFLQQRVKLRNSRCGPRRERAGRNGMHTDAFWSKLRGEVSNSAFERSFGYAHDV